MTDISIPWINIQWKGTESCLDFTCTCGAEYHYDGITFGGLKCMVCGACWRISHEPTLTLTDRSDWHGRELDERHRTEEDPA